MGKNYDIENYIEDIVEEEVYKYEIFSVIDIVNSMRKAGIFVSVGDVNRVLKNMYQSGKMEGYLVRKEKYNNGEIDVYCLESSIDKEYKAPTLITMEDMERTGINRVISSIKETWIDVSNTYKTKKLNDIMKEKNTADKDTEKSTVTDKEIEINTKIAEKISSGIDSEIIDRYLEINDEIKEEITDKTTELNDGGEKMMDKDVELTSIKEEIKMLVDTNKEVKEQLEKLKEYFNTTIKKELETKIEKLVSNKKDITENQKNSIENILTDNKKEIIENLESRMEKIENILINDKKDIVENLESKIEKLGNILINDKKDIVENLESKIEKLGNILIDIKKEIAEDLKNKIENVLLKSKKNNNDDKKNKVINTVKSESISKDINKEKSKKENTNIKKNNNSTEDIIVKEIFADRDIMIAAGIVQKLGMRPGKKVDFNKIRILGKQLKGNYQVWNDGRIVLPKSLIENKKLKQLYLVYNKGMLYIKGELTKDERMFLKRTNR